MKTIKSILFLLMISLILLTNFSCEKSNNEQERGVEQSLSSPDGQFKIANNENELLEKLKIAFNDKNLNVKDLKLKDIKYSKISSSYIADIVFLTKDNVETNVIYTNFNLTNQRTDSSSCYTVTCTSQTCCRVVMYPDETNPRFECSCAGCVMNVKKTVCAD